MGEAYTRRKVRRHVAVASRGEPFERWIL